MVDDLKLAAATASGGGGSISQVSARTRGSVKQRTALRQAKE
jgi:hypothetical protein